MSTPTREELARKFAPSDDPEVQAREQHMMDVMVAVNPRMKQRFVEEGIEKGRLIEARAALRRLLARRRLELQPDDAARIEACEHLGTLERWFEQAITASSVAEALR